MTRLILSLGMAACLGGSSCTLNVTTPLVPPSDSWDAELNTHPDGAAFQALLDRYVEQGLPGVVLLIRTPEGQWNGAAGFARIESSDLMQPTHLFHAASVTKMYMATAVLRLVESGLLDLEREISRYLPASVHTRIPNGATATVRQVLGHRSGIPDFSGDMAFDLDFLNDPTGAYPPERLLSYLEGQGAIHAPGAGYFYSNANYYILALLVDGVAPGGHAGVITHGILEPLQLRSTFYRGQPEYPTPAGLVNSYQDLAGDGRLMNVTDLTVHNDRVFMGNAGLIASSADFADFVEGLLGGSVLSATSLAAMQAWSEPARYGLGLSNAETPYGPGIGHDGADMGALARARHFPDVGATLVLLTNGGDAGVPERLFNALWNEAMEATLGPPP